MSADIVVFDPAAILGAELVSIAARNELDGQEATELSVRAVEIENRLAELVPTSAAGLIAQLRLLRQSGEFEWGEPHEQLVTNLITGLERLG